MTIPSPDPNLVKIVTDHWNASGIEAYTNAHFHEHDEHYWKQQHAQVLYEGFSIAYHERGIKSFGVYPKSPGVTAYQPFPDKPNELYAEDVCEILDDNGVMYWKDVGGGFGGKTPHMNWGEFGRSADVDQHPGAYLPPPRVTGGPVDPVDPPPSGGCTCQAELAALEARIAALEAKPAASLDGKRIALRCEDGTYVWAVGGGSDDVRAKHPHDTPGSDPGGHETFTIKER